MEVAVTRNRQCARGNVAFHLAQGFVQVADQGVVCAACGYRRQLTFDQLAGTDDFQRASRVVQRAHRFAGNDHDARAHAHFDKPFHLQRNQRFPHGRAGYPHLDGQVALRRQPGAHREFTALNELSQLVCNLSVKPTGLYGLERHAKIWLEGKLVRPSDQIVV